MKKIFIAFLLLSLNGHAEEIVQLDFDHLKSHLESKNGQVESSNLSYKAAANRDGFMRRKFLPTFTLEAGGENFSTGPYNNLSQPYGSAIINLNLFNGRRDSFNNEIIKNEIQKKKTEYDQKLLEELYTLRKLYWSYLYQKEVIQILTNALEINSRNLAAAQIRIKSGIATSTDQIEFEQNALQVQQDLNRAKIEFANIEREIKAILVLADESQISSSEIIPHEHSDNILNEIFKVEEHRNNKWLNYQRAIVDNQRQLSKHWWSPSLDVYASAAHFTQKDRDYLTYEARNDYTIGVKLNFNVFDGGEAYNQSKSFYLETTALEKEAAQVRRELKASYQNSRALLELTHGQIHSAEENVKKSEQYFKNTTNEYGRGIKNSPDVLQASQRLVNAKVRLIELKKDYQVSRSSVLYSLGL